MKGPWRWLSWPRIRQQLAGMRRVLRFKPPPAKRWFVAGGFRSREGAAEFGDAADRPGTTRFQWLALVFLGLVTLKLTVASPTQRASPGTPINWKDRDFPFYLQSQQMFQLEPEQLSGTQFRAVERRCRLLILSATYKEDGMAGLSTDDCRMILEALDDFGPALYKHHGYLRLREDCVTRLSAAAD